jgi:hypothetical protein
MANRPDKLPPYRSKSPIMPIVTRVDLSADSTLCDPAFKANIKHGMHGSRVGNKGD